MRDVLICRGVLCVCLLLSVADRVDAQDPDPDPSVTARVRVGPVAFTPAVVLSGGYDTNPYREPGRGKTLELYALPQIEGWHRGNAVRANFWAAGEFVTFSEMVGARNWQVGGRLDRAPASFRPYLRYNLRNTNANPTGFEVGHKSLRIEGDLDVGATVRSGRFSFAGSAHSTRTNWAADAMYLGSSLREKLNRRSNAVRAGVGFSVTPLTAVEFAAERTTDRFTYSPVRDGNGSVFWWGVTFASPAVIQGNAYVGYRRFHSLEAGEADFDGAVATVTIVHVRPAGGFVALRYDRDIQFSYDTSLAYYLSNAFSLTGVVPLTTTWRLQGYAASTTLDYRPAGSPVRGPVYHVLEFGGVVGFRLGEATVVGVTAERAHAKGLQGWNEFRLTCFLTYGSADGRYQRLDRPIPFSR